MTTTTVVDIGVRVLSIRQPWTELILAGHKAIENRTWGTRWRGRLVVHAGQRLDPVGLKVAEVLGIVLDPVLPRGYLGVVEVADVHHDSGDCCDRWAENGTTHWRLTRPRRFAEPIPGAGQRGLYRPPTAVLAAVMSLDTTNLRRTA
jgi:hypothetical protein